ncbi:MAG: hypothetical protein JWN86_1811 [Planctomycetota bacterium]|nr:hypothetical protein [Planctomycetota bacterium]
MKRSIGEYRPIFGRSQESVQAYCNQCVPDGTRTLSDAPFDDLVLKLMRTVGAVQ